MKRLILACVVVCALSFMGSLSVKAQNESVGVPGASAARSPAVAASVLRLVKFSGAVADAHGRPAAAGTVGITFALYADQQGGVPLWLETQNVQLDSQGRYTALLGAGSNEGLPLEIFSSGEARWLGITVQGQPEQARVLLVAVPYALKAADAETLGGRPPSAFVLAAAPTVSGTETTTGETSTSTSATGGSAQIVSGTVGRIAKFTAADAVGDSVLFEDVTGKVGLGTTTPVEQLDIAGPSRTRINLGNQSTVQFASSGFSMRLTQAVDAHTQWDFFAEKNTAGSATGQTTFQIRRRNSAQTEAVTPFLIDKDTNVILQAGFKTGAQTFGNVGIGTAAPTQKLQVLGNIRIAGGGNGLIFPDNSTLLTAAGLGDITAVNTAVGSGLTGGAASGAANLSLLTSCATGQLLKWNGSAWGCAADDVGGGGGGSGWSLTGNAGTTPGTNFLGTTDNVALELHANSSRLLRLEPNVTGGLATGPNVIGGAAVNSVTGGVAGATIGGGGSPDASCGPLSNAACANSVAADFGTVAGGYFNAAGGEGASIGGGENNAAGGLTAVVAGGEGNTASGTEATVGGGATNTASGFEATVAGGGHNTASGDESTVGGGGGNTASGSSATVPGGEGNVASGRDSFAAGFSSNASHEGAFVWSDTNGEFGIQSTAANQFTARATGGVRFITATDFSGNPTAGVTLAAGGGSWASVSDRNLKENLVPVDSRDLLLRLDQIPMATWNYKAQDDSIRHLGPMAQDFFAAFGLGPDDKHITTIDGQGVALAAVQALYRLHREDSLKLEEEEQTVRAQQARLAADEAEISQLKAELAKDEALLEEVRAALRQNSEIVLADARE